MAADRPTPEAVVLVHGLWMNGLELSWLAHRLRRSGYTPYRFHYPSVRETAARNAARLEHFCVSLAEERIHLVGHSLGGLVILQMLSECPPARLGRVVLLGSPIRGSSAARRFSRFRLGRRMLGRSIGSGGLFDERRTIPSDVEIGVIAGTAGIGLGRLFGPLKSPNDGTVTLEETQLPGIRDHLTLPLTHTTLLFSRRTAGAICRFLRCGRFQTASEESDGK
ncbi:MAG: alpha/beta hydrolase [Gammaproteobacteria bacterium]